MMASGRSKAFQELFRYGHMFICLNSHLVGLDLLSLVSLHWGLSRRLVWVVLSCLILELKGLRLTQINQNLGFLLWRSSTYIH